MPAAEFDLPPLPTFASEVQLGPDVRRAFETLCDALDAPVRALIESHGVASPTGQRLKLPSREIALRYLESGTGQTNEGFIPNFNTPFAGWWGARSDEAMKSLLAQPGLPPIAMVRALACAGYVRQNTLDSPCYFLPQLQALVRHYEKHHELGHALGLREFAALMEMAGLSADAPGRDLLHMSGWPSLRWEPESRWQYFAERPYLLEKALGLSAPENGDQWWWRHAEPRRRRAAFDVLASFPHLPARFVDYCWSIALGSAKTERPLARRALAREKDVSERLLAALGDGKQETRYAAAEWLAQLEDPSTVDPLRKALGKEKQDLPRGMMMSALERLGVPVDEFLDRKGLAKEAEKGLAKGIPPDLGWFDFTQLPVVHWVDQKKPIAREVLTWLIVQAYKLKSPEPSAVLRRYAALMKREEAAELESWALLRMVCR